MVIKLFNFLRHSWDILGKINKNMFGNKRSIDKCYTTNRHLNMLQHLFVPYIRAYILVCALWISEYLYNKGRIQDISVEASKVVHKIL